MISLQSSSGQQHSMVELTQEHSHNPSRMKCLYHDAMGVRTLSIASKTADTKERQWLSRRQPGLVVKIESKKCLLWQKTNLALEEEAVASAIESLEAQQHVSRASSLHQSGIAKAAAD
jgi:hypothetical protein